MSPPTTPAPSLDAPKPGTGRRIAPPHPADVQGVRFRAHGQLRCSRGSAGL